MQALRQSTAATVLVGPVLDSSGAAVTNAVIGDFNLTKNGSTAALAAPATATHSHNGNYLIAFATGNTDTLGRLAISSNNSAHSMAVFRFSVLPASVFDALISNATNATGGLVTATGAISAMAGAISTFAGLGANAPTGWINAAAIASGALDDKGNWLKPTTPGRTLTIDTSGNVVLQDGSLTAAKIAAGALNGKGDWSTYAGGDTAGTTTLLGRLTASRAGYLDNLNIAGVAASQADINALNQSASRRVLLVTVPQYERPESGSVTFQLEARTYDGDGAATNADSAPTLTATGVSGTSYAANVSASSNPATGVYRWTYTVSDLHTLEQIRFDLSATLGGSAFTIATYSQVVDFVAAEWTTTDASRLAAIFDKLPSSSFLAGGATASGAVSLHTTQGFIVFQAISSNEFITANQGFEGDLTGRVLGDSATAFVGTGVRAELGANAVSASVLATDATQQIAAAVRDVNNASPAANSLGAAINDRLAAAAYTAPPSAATIAAAVWAVTLTGTRTAGWLMVRIAAALFGKATNSGSQYKDVGDGTTTLLTVTDDGNGDRTVTPS